MNVTTAATGIKIYNLSSGKTLPQWLSEKKKQDLRNNEGNVVNYYYSHLTFSPLLVSTNVFWEKDFRRRIELIHDFDFPVASRRVKVSPDGEYIATTGVYPPSLKVFETQQLSMKFQRHVTTEIDQFLVSFEIKPLN